MSDVPSYKIWLYKRFLRFVCRNVLCKVYSSHIGVELTFSLKPCRLLVQPTTVPLQTLTRQTVWDNSSMQYLGLSNSPKTTQAKKQFIIQTPTEHCVKSDTGKRANIKIALVSTIKHDYSDGLWLMIKCTRMISNTENTQNWLDLLWPAFFCAKKLSSGLDLSLTRCLSTGKRSCSVNL